MSKATQFYGFQQLHFLDHMALFLERKAYGRDQILKLRLYFLK